MNHLHKIMVTTLIFRNSYCNIGAQSKGFHGMYWKFGARNVLGLGNFLSDLFGNLQNILPHTS